MTEYKGMKVGDLITTYHSGFFELVEIEPREISQELIDLHPDVYGDKEVGDAMSPIFKYRKRFTEDGIAKNGKRTNSCDVVYCKPAFGVIQGKIHMLEDTIIRLKQIQC